MAFDPDPPGPPEPEIVLPELHADVRPSIDLGQQWPAWSGWDILLITVITISSIFVLSGVAMAVAAVLPSFRGVPLTELARDARIIVPVQVVAYAIVIGLMALVVRRGYQRRFWRDIEWNFPHGNWYWFIGAGIALAIVVQLSSAVLPIPKQLPIENFFKTTASAYIMAAFGISAAPLFEELFFRGLLYPKAATSVPAVFVLGLIELLIVLIASPKSGFVLWLAPVLMVVAFCGWTLYIWLSQGAHAFQLNEERRRLGDRIGIAATAFCFALIHQSQLGYAWGPLLLLFFVGLVLTAVRARLRTVGGSFLIHVAYNTTLFVLLWVSTDHFRHMEKAAMMIARGQR
jgi:uncharacterized protein